MSDKKFSLLAAGVAAGLIFGAENMRVQKLSRFWHSLVAGSENTEHRGEIQESIFL